MSKQYLTQEQIFESARQAAKECTQAQIAEQLDTSQPAVSQMLRGDSNMLGLALRFLKSQDVRIEHDDDKPVRYYKIDT